MRVCTASGIRAPGRARKARRSALRSQEQRQRTFVLKFESYYDYFVDLETIDRDVDLHTVELPEVPVPVLCPKIRIKQFALVLIS